MQVLVEGPLHDADQLPVVIVLLNNGLQPIRTRAVQEYSGLCDLKGSPGCLVQLGPLILELDAVVADTLLQSPQR